MTDKIDILKELQRPLKNIQWRVSRKTKDKKKAWVLAFIDAREARDRLNEVIGFNNWQTKYSCQDSKTICELILRIENEWITKSDGAGDTNVEAEKGAISGSFKRACTCWGIGEYLYKLSEYEMETLVEIDEWGNILDHQFAKLEEVLKKVEPIYATDEEIEQFLANVESEDEMKKFYVKLTKEQQKNFKQNFTNVKEKLGDK
jgi:hypothetical protein